MERILVESLARNAAKVVSKIDNRKIRRFMYLGFSLQVTGRNGKITFYFDDHSIFKTMIFKRCQIPDREIPDARR